MYTGSTVFSQVMDFVPQYEFSKCVERYQGSYKVRSFPCREQYRCMAFAQLTFRESLRDIETCLRAVPGKLYHMGIRSKVSRSTLAYANETRNWRIYADFAQILIREARQLYINEPLGLELKNTVYALDSTMIDLCLSLFPWAEYQATKGAIKLHTLLDLRGNIPTFIRITDGKVHDVKILDELIVEPGSFYILDRGYIDCSRLYKLTRRSAFFVIRAKSNTRMRRLYSNPTDGMTGINSDHIVVFSNQDSRAKYPDKLRRVRFFDAETQKEFVFLTNNFALPALSIAKLHKCRWQIEIFFKWIKQHLRIKAFFGTSENAVKTQIWIAISSYVLVAILKKQLKLPQSLYSILQVLSVTAFEQTPIIQALSNPDYRFICNDARKQLCLFDF